MICPSEHDEQVSFIKYARARYAHVRNFAIWAIPNAAKRSPRLAAMMRAEGMTSGVPDLIIPYPVGAYHGLWIEMKRQKGGVLSAEQREIADQLRAVGYAVAVCCGAKSAIETLDAYMRGDAIR